MSFRDSLAQLSKEDLLDFIELTVKNFWTLQNNWVINVEKKYGEDAAMELDGMVMGKYQQVENHRLQKFFNLGDDMAALVKVIDNSMGAANLEQEFAEVTEKRAVLRVTKCTMQLQRRKSGLPEIACQKAHQAQEGFGVKVINPKMEIRCLSCPPDPHPEDLWCEWEFTLKE